MRYCNNCGREISDTAKVCPYCGTSLAPRQAEPAAAPAAQPNYNQPNYNQPAGYAPQAAPAYVQPPVNAMANAPITKENLPAEFRPLSAWAYFGLSLLYSVPIVGFVFLIIFSFKKTNINRRSFTRSFWIPIFIALGVFLILLLIGVITGAGAGIFEDLF